MYRFARNITPEHIEAIAAQLFSECLRHGYTSLCEFHYVQRAPDGAMYARPAETAERVVAAARLAGIGVTMLPVLYSYSGFGEQALKPEQQRFRTDAQDVLRIVEALEPLRDAQTEVGVAPHSLRAASVGQIGAGAGDAAGEPSGAHPYRRAAGRKCSSRWTGADAARCSGCWRMSAVDQRWCLVHATHLTRR